MIEQEALREPANRAPALPVVDRVDHKCEAGRLERTEREGHGATVPTVTLAAVLNAPEAMTRNMAAFCRLLGGHSPGGVVVERDGLVAAVVPSCPNQSVVNAVVYENGEAVVAAHAELRAAYVRAGVSSWRVWVPEADRELAVWLERAGHRRGASPRAMMLDLDGFDSGPAVAVEWEHARDPCALAAINEQAYGLPAGEFGGPLEALGQDRAHLYLALERGEPAACAAAIDAGEDCGIYCVATRPQSRGRGLASALMRRALSDAWERGCTTSSLQSSELGLPLYEHLGYRDLGALDVWELRTS
jgi:GNAT superfamily N-acetyltransferase